MPELFEAADYQALIEARYARLSDTLLARWPTARGSAQARTVPAQLKLR